MKKIVSATAYIIKYIFIYWLIINIGGLIFPLFQTISGIQVNANDFYSYSYLITAIFSIIFISVIYMARGDNMFVYCRYKKFDMYYILPVVLISICICLILLIIIPLIIEVFPSYNKVNSLLQKSLSSKLGIMVMIIVAPIFEETFFRGLIFNKLIDKSNITIAVILQALIFGVFHGNVIQFLYTFLLGILLGFIVYKTGSLMASIIAHMSFNLFGGIIFPVLLKDIQSDIIIISLLVVSTIILVVSIIAINKRSYTKVINITNLYISK